MSVRISSKLIKGRFSTMATQNTRLILNKPTKPVFSIAPSPYSKSKSQQQTASQKKSG